MDRNNNEQGESKDAKIKIELYSESDNTVNIHPDEEISDSEDDSSDFEDYSEEEVFKEDEVILRVDDVIKGSRGENKGPGIEHGVGVGNNGQGLGKNRVNVTNRSEEGQDGRKRSDHDVEFNFVLTNTDEHEKEKNMEKIIVESLANRNGSDKRKVSRLDIAPLKCVCEPVNIPCVKCTASLIQQDSVVGSWPMRSNHLSVHWSSGEYSKSKHVTPGRPERLTMSESGKGLPFLHRPGIYDQGLDSPCKSYLHPYRPSISESTILEEDLPVIVRRRGCTLRVKITSITDEDIEEFERQCVGLFFILSLGKDYLKHVQILLQTFLLPHLNQSMNTLYHPQHYQYLK